MGDIEYAGFWIRVAAALIDTIVLMAVLVIPLSLIYGESYWTGDQIVSGFWYAMLSYVFPIVATIWFWLRYRGTPGKMFLKLRIVDGTRGGKMSTRQAIGRYMAYFAAALPLCLGFVWVGLDKRKQGWHDKLADTIVIRDTESKRREDIGNGLMDRNSHVGS